MAFDQATRGRLQRFVNEARKALEEEFTRQLQLDYGLDPASGTVTLIENLRHLNDTQRETARILRDTLAHYCASPETSPASGLDRIVREQAFTVLNRLAALRMAEARGLLIESVGNGYQAKGFQLYARLAGAGLGETGDAYRTYLLSVFDELSQDLPALFDRYSPQGRLFPREAALVQVLSLINHGEIDPLWAEDETIGWIYQYFNSKEERKAMRDASQAPRNSRELAVRNQFFTPRYVVEFLVDNTLGRLWFNWTGGQTGLRERCQFLLVKPDEQPESAKRLRDPRTIKLLDPACGSMHFGLYAFDLFEEIYREAWDLEQTHGPTALDRETGGSPDLKPFARTYADQDALLRDVPRLIIEHNIYGVDIDPRAAQIASLALWLRAQRAWHEAGVKAKDRPQVGQGQVVAAVAPPAEVDLRKRFMEDLDPLDAELFEQTLFMLKGLPELGVLLQVEKELPALIRKVYGEHGDLFRAEDLAQWENAEARLRAALTEYARAARSTYQGRLFVEDALQGLRMIDHCREVFDVVVMNPPFGLPSDGAKRYLETQYLGFWTDYYNTFIKRTSDLLQKEGFIGAVVPDRLKFTKKSIGARQVLTSSCKLRSLVDVGRDVMDDAAVDALFFTAGGIEGDNTLCDIFDLRGQDISERENYLRNSVDADRIEIDLSLFKFAPGNAFAYSAPLEYLDLLQKNQKLDPDLAVVATGGKTFDDFRFLRLRWEVPPSLIGDKWISVDTGGDYQPWLSPSVFVQNWRQDGHELRTFATSKRGTDAQAAQGSKNWFKPGLSYPYTSSIAFGPRILPKNTIFTSDAIAILPHKNNALEILSFVNSSWTIDFLDTFGEGRKTENSLVKKLPVSADSISHGRLGELATRCCLLVAILEQSRETSPYFSGIRSEVSHAEIRFALKGLVGAVDDEVSRIYLAAEGRAPAERASDFIDHFASDLSDRERVLRELSYLVGQAFKRWSVETNRSPQSINMEQLFDELPMLPPAQLNEPDPKNCIDILDVDGNDKCLPEIIIEIYQLVSDDVSILEREIQTVFNGARLIDIFASDGIFFDYHFRTYSKGGRRAPIYWPLSTTSGSYTLWIYYPSLTNQTLYTAVNDFVEPKLKQVSRDAATLRDKGAARTRDDEKAFEALQALELELIELRDTLLDIAPTYRPDHDDGVQITAAPLWPLFRHKPWQKVLKDTWAKLEKGDYDWAHLAMSYWPDRVREKCKTDKSLAIAHDLEDLYEPTPSAEGGKKKKKGSGV